ncbi:hypothetical protein DMC30DRAFT_394924 [Rhodotorula diobovata]|uniref:Uncharacterized protein n=1 Tax=Rhodotorula diobovata TaxID=5288 RepID=A0A5C5FX57_9BASI|nr:hypothetical protein DMC30DRAFT_394924 [Rhodotorula diobovata]
MRRILVSPGTFRATVLLTLSTKAPRRSSRQRRGPSAAPASSNRRLSPQSPGLSRNSSVPSNSRARILSDCFLLFFFFFFFPCSRVFSHLPSSLFPLLRCKLDQPDPCAHGAPWPFRTPLARARLGSLPHSALLRTDSPLKHHPPLCLSKPAEYRKRPRRRGQSASVGKEGPLRNERPTGLGPLGLRALGTRTRGPSSACVVSSSGAPASVCAAPPSRPGPASWTLARAPQRKTCSALDRRSDVRLGSRTSVSREVASRSEHGRSAKGRARGRSVWPCCGSAGRELLGSTRLGGKRSRLISIARPLSSIDTASSS